MDDILARGSRKQTKLFWEVMGTRFGLKHWDIAQKVRCTKDQSA